MIVRPGRASWARAVVLSAVLLLAACGGRGEPEPPAASGSLGELTAADARRMLDGLCRIAGPAGEDRGEANAAFFDLAHDALHRLAAATQPMDSDAAGRLLVAKERVEADLRGAVPPPDLRGHAEALLAAARRALRAVGLPAPACGA